MPRARTGVACEGGYCTIAFFLELLFLDRTDP